MIEGHRVILRETVQSFSSKGIDAMTTAHNIDLPAVLAERLTTCHPTCCASCLPRSSTEELSIPVDWGVSGDLR
ncbi:hypothetical protein, partial [Mycobacterium avium]